MGHGPWHPILLKLNQINREVAAKTGAKLVDFEVTSQPSYFLDDLVHLTREGNTAEMLVQSFSTGEFPFHKPSGH
jgi:hypothetical protein